MVQKQKIAEFTDLIAWQKAHLLVLKVYEITKKMPKNESYGLISQMQRSVVSITSNIAEGFARRSKKEKTQFYYTSLGSLSEFRNQLIICRDIKYIDNKDYVQIEQMCLEVRMMMNGLVKSSQEYTKF